MASLRVRRVSPASRRILRAAIAAIRPRGHGFDQPIDDDVLRAIEEFFPHLPGPLRIALPAGLRLLEYGPPFLARRLARFSTMPRDEATAYLVRFQRGGRLRAALVMGLRALVFLAFYQHPDVLASLEVDWAGRSAMLVRRRAELLHAAG
jgi:hypothetical protein